MFYLFNSNTLFDLWILTEKSPAVFLYSMLVLVCFPEASAGLVPTVGSGQPVEPVFQGECEYHVAKKSRTPGGRYGCNTGRPTSSSGLASSPRIIWFQW